MVCSRLPSNGRTDAREACQIPATCNDGKRTGKEECDPPTPGFCDDTCHLIDACTTCSRDPEGICFTYEQQCDDTDPARQAGCRAVLDCWRASHCGDPFHCYCGSLDAATCFSVGGQGACKQPIEENAKNPAGATCASLPASLVPACVSQYFVDPSNAAGMALQIVQCRLDNGCATACGY
jgi:hypothetical protein